MPAEPVHTSFKMRTRQPKPPPSLTVNTAHWEYFLRITPQHAVQINSIPRHNKYETRYYIEILHPAGPGCDCPALPPQGHLGRLWNLGSSIETIPGEIRRPDARPFGAALLILVTEWRMNPKTGATYSRPHRDAQAWNATSRCCRLTGPAARTGLSRLHDGKQPPLTVDLGQQRLEYAGEW